MLDELLVGQSAPMREIKRLIELVAPSTTTVLVQGETGTGKELVAQAIHVRLSLQNCWNLNYSVMRKALSPELKKQKLAGLRWHQGAHYS